MAERETHGTEPPAPIAAAMAAADVVLCPTLQSLSHTAARRAATEAGARIATLPGVTEEMLARVMSADMEGLRRKGGAIAERLTAGVGGADHLRARIGPAARARRPRGDPRRRRPDRPGRVRQPAVRRGLHRADRGHRRGPSGRRRDDRGDRPRLRAGGADGRGRAIWSRRAGRTGSACSSFCAPTARARRTSPSSGSAPTRRPSSPASCSRTRRSSAPSTSPSAPRRRSAARSRCPSTSTASCWSPTLSVDGEPILRGGELLV